MGTRFCGDEWRDCEWAARPLHPTHDDETVMNGAPDGEGLRCPPAGNVTDGLYGWELLAAEADARKADQRGAEKQQAGWLRSGRYRDCVFRAGGAEGVFGESGGGSGQSNAILVQFAGEQDLRGIENVFAGCYEREVLSVREVLDAEEGAGGCGCVVEGIEDGGCVEEGAEDAGVEGDIVLRSGRGGDSRGVDAAAESSRAGEIDFVGVCEGRGCGEYST